jgi:hypothetical protein
MKANTFNNTRYRQFSGKFWGKCFGACALLVALEANASSTNPTAADWVVEGTFKAGSGTGTVVSGQLPTAMDHSAPVGGYPISTTTTWTYAFASSQALPSGQSISGSNLRLNGNTFFTLNTDGSYTFTPPTNFVGNVAKVNYTVSEKITTAAVPAISAVPSFLDPNTGGLTTPIIGVPGVDSSTVTLTSQPYTIDLFIPSKGFDVPTNQALTLGGKITGAGPLLVTGGDLDLQNTANDYTNGVIKVGGKLVYDQGVKGTIYLTKGALLSTPAGGASVVTVTNAVELGTITVGQ